MKSKFDIVEDLKSNISTENIESVIDLSDITISNIINGELVDNIPVLKTLNDIRNVGRMISDFAFAKKYLAFIDEFNNGELDNLQKIRDKFNDNKKFQNKLIETVLLYLEKMNQDYEARILARLFKAYLDGEYTWNQFIY